MVRARTRYLETDLEDEVRREAKNRWGVESLKITPRGDTGWQDVIFWVPGGRPLLIEFKRPGEEPQPRQTYIANFLRSIGYQVEIHDDKSAALQAISDALAAA